MSHKHTSTSTTVNKYKLVDGGTKYFNQKDESLSATFDEIIERRKQAEETRLNAQKAQEANQASGLKEIEH